MKKFASLPSKNRTVSTTDVLILPNRRCGNTTRIVDKVIQDLFAGKLCRIVDHHPTEKSAQYTWRKILDRLSREHNFVYEGSLCVNKEMYCMWLAEAFNHIEP